MSKNSFEFSVEEFFLKLFRSDKRLAGKTLVHFDEERKATSNVIVVSAKQGNNNLAGFGGFDCEVTVEYRSPTKTTKKVNDRVAEALQDVIYRSVLPLTARAHLCRQCAFSDFLIKDESTSDRQNSSELRKRTMTFPVQAKLA